MRLKWQLTPSRYYIVYVVWLAIETTIIFFVYPETKGKSWFPRSCYWTQRRTDDVFQVVLWNSRVISWKTTWSWRRARSVSRAQRMARSQLSMSRRPSSTVKPKPGISQEQWAFHSQNYFTYIVGHCFVSVCYIHIAARDGGRSLGVFSSRLYSVRLRREWLFGTQAQRIFPSPLISSALAESARPYT